MNEKTEDRDRPSVWRAVWPHLRDGGPYHAGMAYRPDIDGLRALAVVPIVLNHVNMRGFAGGYIGVDIFFVISGFLITGILLRDIDRGTFSIASFYRRRILRIFPALFAMLAIVALVCLPVLMPGEMQRFAKSLLGTTFFVSNFVFYSEAGYFDTASHTKPLLHTWSLGIEEQFYILWPLLIAAFTKISRRAAIVAMIAITVASFFFAIWQVQHDITGAFYLLPSRAWELGLGGLIALLPTLQLPRLLREGLAVLGGALIAFAVWRFFPPIIFPGLTALVPCVGTALLLLFAPGTLAGRLLSMRPATFIGQISYSLYLWHWPVIVLSQIGLFLYPSAWGMIGQLAVSLVLATLSWRWIEQSFRNRPELADTSVLRNGGFVMAVATAVSVALFSGNGLDWRFTPAEQKIAAFADRDYESRFRRGECFIIDATDDFDSPNCLLEPGEKPSILLVGDSMAAHYWPGLARYRKRFAISQATMAGCRPNLYPIGTDRRCEKFFREMLMQKTRRRPTVVIMSGNWQPMDMALLRQSLPILKRAGVPLLLLGPVPQYEASLPRLLVFARRQGRPELVKQGLMTQTFAVDREMAQMAREAGVRYFSPVERLCTRSHCRTFANEEVPLQFDYGHLTPAGAAVVVDQFMPIVTAIAEAGPPPVGKQALPHLAR